MSRPISSLIIICIVFFSACKKESNKIESPANSSSFIDSSVQFIKLHISNADFNALNLTKVEQLKYLKKNIGIKVFERNNASTQFLILVKRAGIFEANWVDMTNLILNKSDFTYNGSIFIQSMDRKSGKKIIVKKNKVIDVNYVGDGYRHPDNVSPELPEIIIYYDVYRADNSDVGGNIFISLYWLLNQDSYYSGFYYQNSSGSNIITGGSRPADQPNVYAAPTFISPDKPITDFQKEMGCFTINNNSTYDITVDVNQPDPNSRDVFDPLAVFPVGHTFLTFQQHNADGTSIIRNIGFYPKNEVKPGYPIDQSVFGDDSDTPFDVSLSFTVSAAEFNTVIRTLSSQQAMQYDLNNFNCTNSPMDALKSININLPSTKSNQLLFSGNDPGDLGEDIRNLNLNDFSAANGNRKIIRVVSNSNDQKPPAKKGIC